MNGTSTRPTLALAVSAVALLLAAGAIAQETPAQSRARTMTQSLNGGPAETTLQRSPSTRLAPPVATAPQARRPAETRALDRTLEDLLGSVGDESEADEADTANAPSGVTLAEGETAPAPIPVALGYYVRDDKDCDQVWPGDGDLAFMTPTTFTIDFGGCAPGQFLQTGPNSWREEQMCETELGGDAGAYVVDYEMVETGVLSRSARLELDGSVEQDLWRFCELPEVPENARFRS
jgi:hypothetical protein